MPRMTYSPVALDATTVLGQQIRQARVAKGWTVRQLAEALGVSQPTVLGIEHGKPTTAVGTVLSAAVAVGVAPFGADRHELARLREQGKEKLALIPQRVRLSGGTEQFDDDF